MKIQNKDFNVSLNNVAGDASKLPYDNSSSEIEATTVQEAIDETNNNISSLSDVVDTKADNSTVTSLSNTVSGHTTSIGNLSNDIKNQIKIVDASWIITFNSGLGYSSHSFTVPSGYTAAAAIVGGYQYNGVIISGALSNGNTVFAAYANNRGAAINGTITAKVICIKN